MKLAIYLTKNKVSFLGKSFDWAGDDLIKIFKGIRLDERVKDVRIVLGNDVSYIVSFKQEGNLSRDEIAQKTKESTPIVFDEKCFDYRIMIFSGDESWIQSVTVEKWFLEAVSKAVKESGLSLENMIPMGILLGEKTIGRDTPTLVKWSGFESLSILAVNGLVDSVHVGEADEVLNAYAKNKWNLAVNLEQMIFDDKSFELSDEVFREKNRGEDKDILNIPVFKKNELATPKNDFSENDTFEPVKKKSMMKELIIIIALFVALSMIFIFIWIFAPKKNNSLIVEPTPTRIPTQTITLTATPTQVPDFSSIKVQILNGSGVSGEAAAIRKSLLVDGFVTVDIGNTESVDETKISKKENVASEVEKIVVEKVKRYKVGIVELLTEDSKYDLVIVLGSEKK